MSVAMRCWCGTEYKAKTADLNRGWGLSCSKHCAAVRRDFGRPAAKRVDGLPLTKPEKKKPSSYRKTPSPTHSPVRTVRSVARYVEDFDDEDYANFYDGMDYLSECGDKD